MPLFSVVGSTLALALEDTLLLTDTSSPDAPVVRCVEESAHQASSAAADGDGDAGADAETDANADGGDAAATGGIVAVALNADGSLAVTAHNDKELRVWRVADGTCVSRRTLAKKPTTLLVAPLPPPAAGAPATAAADAEADAADEAVWRDATAEVAVIGDKTGDVLVRFRRAVSRLSSHVGRVEDAVFFMR